MEQKIITIVGGTGFIGRYVVQTLARAGYRLRVVSRNPKLAAELKTYGDVGQISLISGNICNVSSIIPTLKDAYAVIDLVGILYERGKQNFTAIHAQGADKLAAAAKSAGVERFIFVSALGSENDSKSKYARSKILGERAVMAAFPEATILRPSVVFGAEDNFFNKFACMASLAPALPLIGGGKTRFQPVFAGDVALAVANCLKDSETIGEIYELGGNHTYTLKEILEYILGVIDKKKSLVNIPFGLASLIGFFGEFMPTPPLTRDQVELLKFDNLVSKDANNFASLGIKPKSVEEIVPSYLERFHRRTESKFHA